MEEDELGVQSPCLSISSIFSNYSNPLYDGPDMSATDSVSLWSHCPTVAVTQPLTVLAVHRVSSRPRPSLPYAD